MGSMVRRDLNLRRQMTHATGCRNAYCLGCMRAGEGNSPGSPTEAMAMIDQSQAALDAALLVIAKQQRFIEDLQAKLDSTEKRLSNLELKTRGVPWSP